MKTKVKLSIAFFVILVAIHCDDQKKEECLGPHVEICGVVGSDTTLPFPLDFSGSVTESLWTWTKKDFDLCFCRNGRLNFADLPEYKGRIKVSCENLAKGDGSITVIGVREADNGLYTLRNDACIRSVNFVVVSNETSCKEAVSRTKGENLNSYAELPNNLDQQITMTNTTNSTEPGKAHAKGLAISVPVVLAIIIIIIIVVITVKICKMKSIQMASPEEHMEMQNLNSPPSPQRDNTEMSYNARTQTVTMNPNEPLLQEVVVEAKHDNRGHLLSEVLSS